MSKFTPGPWEVVTNSSGYISRIRSSDSERNKIAGVCYDINRHNGFAMPSSEEGKANAHLIAAAPDLYEALKSIKQSMIDFRRGKVSLAHIKIGMDMLEGIADEALAKAEGKQ